MFVEYEDILCRVRDKPLWWHHGLPRFDPFEPKDVSVYARQVALAHTECQDCGARYDVAVMPDREWTDLRDSLAYTNELPVGDPPNALHTSGGRCAGATMGSIQIRILQFWEMRDVQRGWTREPTLEHDLAGAEWKTGQPAESILSQIHASERRREWLEAREQGNFAALVSILEDFECERPREVAHAIDLQRRDQAFLNERIALRRERFGST